MSPHNSYRGKLLDSVPDSERSLSAQIKEVLEAHGCKVFSTELHHRPSGKTLTPGIPDLIVFWPEGGRFVFIELKTPTGKLRQRQAEFRDYCVSCDAPWSVWRSVDDAIGWLEG